MKRVFAILFFAAVCAGCEKSGRIYRIGDIYSENGKQGIVFYVTDEGRHGKIVSLDETRCVWQSNFDYPDPETYDYLDGMKNMKAVRSQPDWHDRFPAFAWCADKGDGWYLPAETELLNLYAAHIFEYDEEHWCWSSTSNRYLGGSMLDTNRALLVDIWYCYVGSAVKYRDEYYVRAIAKF